MEHSFRNGTWQRQQPYWREFCIKKPSLLIAAVCVGTVLTQYSRLPGSPYSPDTPCPAGICWFTYRICTSTSCRRGRHTELSELNGHLKHTNAVGSTTKIREKCLSTWEGLLTDISTNGTISQACFWLMWVPCPCQKHVQVIPPLPQYTFFWDFVCFWTLLVCRSGPTAALDTDTRQETTLTILLLRPFPHSAHVAWP